MAHRVVGELGAQTEARLRQWASEQGVSLKQCITELLRRHTLAEWREDVL